MLSAEEEFGRHYITSVIIPDSVTKIGRSAFEKCVMLESVTIGNSVETVGYQRLFINALSLKSITIPTQSPPLMIMRSQYAKFGKHLHPKISPNFKGSLS